MTPVASDILVDNWTRRRTATFDLVEIVIFGLLTAALAQVRIPLPFTPVPITGQTLGVLLAGAVLGARRGFLSQSLYLVLGAAGFHFAGGSLLGPTAGYLLTFPLAALMVGVAVERGAARRGWKLGATLAAADLVILTGGALWLAFSLRLPLRQAWMLGVAPFWLGEILKIGIVVSLVSFLLGRRQRIAH